MEKNWGGGGGGGGLNVYHIAALINFKCYISLICSHHQCATCMHVCDILLKLYIYFMIA